MGDPVPGRQGCAGYRRFLPLIPAGTPIHEGLVALSLVEKPDARLAAVLDEWAQGLAAGLLNLIHIKEPGSIVLGGALAVLYPRVAARVEAALAANLVHGLAVPPIGIARFGADVAAIGAAAIVREALFALPTLEPAWGRHTTLIGRRSINRWRDRPRRRRPRPS
jgi:hypothetical protein